MLSIRCGIVSLCIYGDVARIRLLRLLQDFVDSFHDAEQTAVEANPLKELVEHGVLCATFIDSAA